MKREHISIWIILILALVVRLAIINFGLPSKNMALTTYNPDEAISFWSIEKWSPKKLDFHPRGGFFWGGHHLYQLAASLGVAKVLGYVKFGGREFYINNLKEADKLYLVGRFLMLLYAVASVLLIYFVGAIAYNRTAGLMMASMLAICPAHLVNSAIVRPDVMMLFWGILATYFSVKLLKTGITKFYIFSCLSVGFATGTKYSGAVFGIAPIVAHFLAPYFFLSEKRCKQGRIKEKLKDVRLYLIPLICLVGFCISSPYIIIDFNRTSESFLSYLKVNFSLSQGAMDLGQLELLGYGPLSYIKHYLVYGLGQVIVIASLIGAGLMIFKTRSKFDILFLVSGIVILFVVSSTKNQTVWYTFPVIPFIIIFAIRGVDIILTTKSKFIFSIGVVFAAVVFGFTSVYSVANWRLYFQKNVREKASEWIEKNIPKGSKVAIARSYFWTPGILRQYEPPYKVLMGGDPIKSSVEEAVLGLKNILAQAEYLVLTEYEYRQFLHPKLEKYFPGQSRIMKDIFLEEKFKKITEFNKEAKFLWFTFRKDYPPGDWLIPNPKIVVFKRR